MVPPGGIDFDGWLDRSRSVFRAERLPHIGLAVCGVPPQRNHQRGPLSVAPRVEDLAGLLRILRRAAGHRRLQALPARLAGETELDPTDLGQLAVRPELYLQPLELELVSGG